MSYEYNADLDKQELNKILDVVYPVGSIYMSVNSTDPGTLFGGSWISIHGRFLVAEGNNGATGEAALNLAAGATGGKKIVTLSAAQSGMRAHTHAVGSHYHNLYNHHHTPNTTGENFLCVDTTVSNASFTISTAGNNRYTVGYPGTGHFHARADTGKPDSNNTGNTTYSTRASDGTLSGTAYTGAVKDISGADATTSHENMPPYLAVYMWKRIA